MVGLGRLGLPVSCAMVQKNHKVFGYDINTELTDQLKRGECPYYEPNINEILKDCLDDGLAICDTLESAVKNARIIFIAVPTPSNNDDSFNTSYVKDVLKKLGPILLDCYDYKVVSIISTVLPGTTRNEFLPILISHLGLPGQLNYGLCYNAQFIAMGTTLQDMLNPEFVLIGEYNKKSGDTIAAFYSRLVDAPLLRMSIENAETVKMAYNTMIGFKIVYANTLMELCDKIEYADCDVVTGAISKATKRLLSPRYLTGGMGDAGGCHPRDNRALSYLAKKLDLSADPFEFVMDARDKQSRYLASVVRQEWENSHLPICVMGLTFKPETNLTTESCSYLLINHMKDAGIPKQEILTFDPIVQPSLPPNKAMIYVIATKHKEFEWFKYADGSVVIDPWRILDKPPHRCIYRPIGRQSAWKNDNV
jgi:UDPglucose 6-dehydrogenase